MKRTYIYVCNMYMYHTHVPCMYLLVYVRMYGMLCISVTVYVRICILMWVIYVRMYLCAHACMYWHTCMFNAQQQQQQQQAVTFPLEDVAKINTP